MVKSFLRSGSLDDILALGENGQPVYTCAFQIREALRLKKQQYVADCLAIPQLNEQNDRIDWYAPIEGKVTSWLAASSAERKAAIKQLSVCLSSVNELRQRAEKSEIAAQRLFGELLAKAFQFPDQNHVYLVAGKPVLTFWGFVSADKKMRTDPFDCLRLTIETIIPPIIEPITQVQTVTHAQAVTTTAPVITPVATEIPPVPEVIPVEPTPPEPTPEPAKPPTRWLSFSWILPVLALIVALIVQFSGGITDKASTAPVVIKSIIDDVESMVTKPVIQLIEPQLPLDKATVTPPSESVATATEPVLAVPPPPATVVSKNALILPADSVRIGSTAFLNGNWRVSPDIKPTHTGKAPSLRYQFKNGKGTVKITHGDNITCSAIVTAGLMQSGNLVINSRYRAQCSDGSRYRIPEIVCKQGVAGIAECQGRYDADTVLSMTMMRENK